LNHLKDNAIESDKVWKAAGRPRSDKRNADKRQYKKMLHRERQAETQSYTNDLHDALISKSSVNFWKCSKSKFEKKNKSNKFIDGLGDDTKIAEAFAEHFRKSCTSFRDNQNNYLQAVYYARQPTTYGTKNRCRHIHGHTHNSLHAG